MKRTSNLNLIVMHSGSNGSTGGTYLQPFAQQHGEENMKCYFIFKRKRFIH